MNYLKHYLLLMRKAEGREVPDGYTEKHHIFPVSLYGENNRLVSLTAREHYIAHLLLAKAFMKRYGKCKKTFSCVNALCRMRQKSHGRDYYNSHIFAIAREMMAENMKGNDYAKGMVYDKDSWWIVKRREAYKESRWYNNGVEQVFQPEKPDGWQEGRIVDWNRDNSGTNNPMCMKWQLTMSDGDVIIVEGLRSWCAERDGINYHGLYDAYKRGSSYKNIIMEIIKL